MDKTLIAVLFGLLFSCLFACNDLEESAPPFKVLTVAQKSGADCVSVSPSLMNFFYIGVDNDLEVRAEGVAVDDLELSCQGAGCRLLRKEEGGYIVRVGTPGNVEIVVRNKAQERKFHFRSKRLPTPVASFHPKKLEAAGKMTASSFKARRGVLSPILSFDLEVRCKVQGFQLTRIHQGEKTQVMNRSGNYSPKTTELVAAAQVGDVYYYTQVKAKCPGDAVSRLLTPMVWEIK